MTDSTSPNEETVAQPSVGDIAARIAAEDGQAPPSPVELEDYAGPEHALAEDEPTPAASGRGPVERKVIAGSVWATLVPTLLWVAGLVAENIDALAPVLAVLPVWARLGVVTVAGGLAAFYGAYRAEHTPRPDLHG